MTNTVLIKRSSTANSVPASGNLQAGELAINYTDGNLFYKDNNNGVQLLTSNKFVSVTGNITGANLNATGLSLSGNVVSNVNVTSNIAGGNIKTPGLISATGNITGNYFIGNGSRLTSLTAANVVGNVANATYATTSGTVTTAAQPNITSVGTLSSVSVGGNIYTPTNGTGLIGGPQGSGYVANLGSYTATIAYASQYIFSTSNFTIEFWFKPSSFTNGGFLVTGAAIQYIYDTSGIITVYLSSNGSAWNISNAALTCTTTIGAWSHIALVRNGSTFTLYKDGISQGTVTSALGIYNPASTISLVNAIDGYISNYRLAIGVAVYTSAFSTPNSTLGATQTSNTNGNPSSAITGTQTKLLAFETSSSTTDLSSYAVSITAASINMVSQTIPFGQPQGTFLYDGSIWQSSTIAIAGNISVTGPVSASGNVTGNYFIGNGSQLTGITTSAGSAITNGTSDVTVSANSNITANVSGTTIATFASTGEYVTGIISATGNVTGNYFIGNGSLLTGISSSSYGNANVAANLAAFGTNPISTSGNITGGNFLTGGLISATGNITGGNLVTSGSGGAISGTGNITAGNLTTGGVVSAGSLSLSGNVTSVLNASSSIAAGTTISAVGNITGNYFIGNGSQLTGLPATYGNANVAANLAAFGTNPISTSGNITGGYILGNGSQLTGIAASYGNANVAANLAAFGTNPISTTGNITGGNLFTGGSGGAISGTGNITAGNLITGGILSATGNITGGNVSATALTGTIVSVTGNVTGNYFIGNGSQLTGLPATYGNANVAANLAAFGTNPISTSGNITGGNLITGGSGGAISGTGNITAGNLITGGLVSATGNIIGGNLNSVGLISVSGNVTGNYFLGNGALLTGVITSVANINNGTSNVTVVSSGGNITIGVAGTSNVVVFASSGEYVTGVVSATGNITGGNLVTSGSGGAISGTGNITAGNLLTSGILSATGNVTGNFFIGNGSQLTGISSSYGNANVVANLAALGNNPISTTGNVTGNYFIGNGSQLTGIVSSYGNANVAANLAAFGSNPISTTGNVTGGNILGGANVNATTHTGTTVSVTGNITGGNINAAGLSLSGNVISALISSANITTTANISGSYLLGNGSQLTGLPVTYGNANVAANLAAFGNNPISTGGNITGGNFYAPTTNTGLIGGVLGSTYAGYFNGTTQYLTVPNANVLAGAGNLTIEFWAYPMNSSGRCFIGGSDWELYMSGWEVRFVQQGSYGFNSGLNVTPDTWNHVVLSRDSFVSGTSGNWRIFVNGTMYTTTSNGGSPLSSPSYLGIGISVDGGGTRNPFEGYLSNFRIVNGVGVYTSAFTPSTTPLTPNQSANVNGSPSAALTTGQTRLLTLQNSTIVDNSSQVLTITNYNTVVTSTSSVLSSTAQGTLIYDGSAWQSTSIMVTGTLSATGNVTGNFFIGNGSQLTGIASTYGNANVAANLAAFGTNPISTSGNITAGNILGGANVNATTHTGTTVSVTGNITGGNVLGGANVNATAFTGSTVSVSANVTGGNIITSAAMSAGSVSASGNVTGGNVNTNTIVGTATTIRSTGALNLSATGNIVVNSTYISGVLDPVQNQDVATKNYVDTVASGLHVHQAANLASTSDLATYTGATVTYNNGASGVGATLSLVGNTLTTLDGTAIPASSSTRLLIKNQGNSVQNGVYNYTSTSLLTRSIGEDTNGELNGGDFLFVLAGATNADTGWVQSTDNVVIGTSPIVFTQFSGAGTYTANTAAGLVLNGTVFSAKVDNISTAFDGTGNIVVKASAQLTTPNIGAATGTSLSVTGNVTGGNILGGANVNATTHTGATVSITGNVIAGGGIVTRVVSIADGTSVTINADTTDLATQTNTQVTGTLTINAPTGTLANGQKIMLRLQSSNVQTFSWNAVFAGSTDLSLPTVSSGSSKYDYVGFIYNTTATKWQILAKNFGF